MMTASRRRPGLDPQLIERAAHQDVRIGAQVRRERRRQWLVGGAGAALLIFGVLLARQLPAETSGDSRSYAVTVECALCDRRTDLVAELGNPESHRCAHCGATGALPVWRCLECSAEFREPERGLEQICPKCRSPRIGATAAPALP